MAPTCQWYCFIRTGVRDVSDGGFGRVVMANRDKVQGAKIFSDLMMEKLEVSVSEMWVWPPHDWTHFCYLIITLEFKIVLTFTKCEDDFEKKN